MEANAIEYSPEALEQRLGSEVYAMAVAAAHAAPPPSPAKVEAVRRILAPAVARCTTTRVKVRQPALDRAA
jgi:hypothetical protein